MLKPHRLTLNKQSGHIPHAYSLLFTIMVVKIAPKIGQCLDDSMHAKEQLTAYLRLNVIVTQR